MAMAETVHYRSPLEWIHLSCTSFEEVLASLPTCVVSGGVTEKGEETYVARAECGYNDIACGAYIPSRPAASVPYGSCEVISKSCDILVCYDPEILHWVDASDGDVPDHAIAVNTKSYGERIYVSRSRPNTSLTGISTCNNKKIKIDKTFEGPMLGKLHPSHHTMYLGYDKSEYFVKDYQVLCAYLPPPVPKLISSLYMWVPASNGYIPENGLVGGRILNDELTYVGRVMHNGDYRVGYVVPSEKVCYFTSVSRMPEPNMSSSDYEVLVPSQTSHFNWIRAHGFEPASNTINPQLKTRHTLIGRSCIPFETSSIDKTTNIVNSNDKVQFVGIVNTSVLYFTYDNSIFNRFEYERLVVDKIPNSLQELCRHAVLEGTSAVPHRINRLPLPEKMKHYCHLRSDESRVVQVDCDGDNLYGGEGSYYESSGEDMSYLLSYGSD